ncbi:MAG TPA: GNAT family N-acetyltransferase [Candidatus Acidoferrum sp.]|jgi:predicted GNAT family acetyltransferase
MSVLPEHLFANPVWHALHSQHRHLSVSAGDNACRYPADVVPFVAVDAPTISSMQQLHSLLAPNESVWLFAKNFPLIPELIHQQSLNCFQMSLPANVIVPDTATNILPLSDANAHEMVALTTLAFPGYFRPRTYEMGSYFGVRSSSGELIAMGGERLKLDDFSEISAVCTHPSFRGQGLAASLIWRLVRDHRRDGLVSWLHVACANQHAIDLYLRLGFVIVRKITLQRFSRNNSLD